MLIHCLNVQAGSMDKLQVMLNMLHTMYMPIVIIPREERLLLITVVPSMVMSLVAALVTSHTLQVNGTGRLVMWVAIP